MFPLVGKKSLLSIKNHSIADGRQKSFYSNYRTLLLKKKREKIKGLLNTTMKEILVRAF